MSIQSISSIKAYNMLTLNDNAILIDVRTEEEWKIVGIPDLIDKQKVFFLSWELHPVKELDAILKLKFENKFLSTIQDKTSNLLFLCRSGYRSLAAATFIANMNYKNCHNVTDGFEGWKQNNLPYIVNLS